MKRIIKTYCQHFWSIFLIIFLTILAWHKVLNQTFDHGDGWHYFVDFISQRVWGEVPRNTLNIILAYDTQARLLAKILFSLFKDSFLFYQAFLLVVVCLVNLLFYFMTYELTNKKVIALAAFVFFGINLVSSEELFATGNYHYFLQRIPNLILVFTSFILFVKLFKGRFKKKIYLFSLLLWFLAVVLAQFSIFFLPMFVFYPLSLWLNNKKKNIKNLKRFLIPILPFFFVAFLLFWLDENLLYSRAHLLIGDKGNNFLTYIFQIQQWWGNFVYQLAFVILPKKAMILLANPEQKERLIIYTTLLLPIYLIIFSCVWYYCKRFRSVLLTVFFFIAATLFLNTYLTDYQIELIYWSSRYFYVPFMGMSIFLSIFLYRLFFEKNKPITLCLFFIGAWLSYQNLNEVLIKLIPTLLPVFKHTFAEFEQTLSDIISLFFWMMLIFSGVFFYLAFFTKKQIKKLTFFILACSFLFLLIHSTAMGIVPRFLAETFKVAWATRQIVDWRFLLSTLFFLLLAFLSLFDKKNYLGKLAFFSLVTIWAIYNFNLIWTRMDQAQPDHRAIKKAVQYFKENTSSFSNDALVIIPYSLPFQPFYFANEQYLQSRARFEAMHDEWENLPEDFSFKDLVVLDYDHEEEKIVDRSEEFRVLIKKGVVGEELISVKQKYQAW